MEQIVKLIESLKIGLNNKRIRTVCEYILVVVLLFQSAGIRKDAFFSLKIVVIMVVVAVYAALRYEQIRSRINIRQGVGCLALLVVFAAAACATNGFESFATYAGVVCQYAIGFFVAATVPYKNFRLKYFKVMTVLAAGSLVIFAVQVVAPVLLYWLPQYDNGSATTYYFDAGISAVMAAKGWLPQIVFANRNSGFCWEPGCYQVFLSIALAIAFERCANIQHFHWKDLTYIGLFAVALITTMSFTAFLLLVCIILFNFKTCLRILIMMIEKNKWTKAITIGGLSVAVVMILYILMTRLMATTGESGYTFSDRINLAEIKYIFVNLDGSINLTGMSFQDATEIPTAFGGFANSIVYAAVCLGLPSVVLLLAMNLKTSFLFLRDKWLYFIIVVVSFSTEGLLYKVFFMTLAFMGVLYSQGKKASQSKELRAE